MRKIIIAPESKEELAHFLDDVNYDVPGKQLILDEKLFSEFWESTIINQFHSETEILIDDFEDTVVTSIDEITKLKAIVKNSSLSFRRQLIEICQHAIDMDSGVIFFF